MAPHKVVPRPGGSWIHCARAHTAFNGYTRQRGGLSHISLISIGAQLTCIGLGGELSRNTLLHVKLPLVEYSCRIMIGYLVVVHVMQGLLLVNIKGVVHDQGMISTCT